jgi:glucose uptake protein GlcU
MPTKDHQQIELDELLAAEFNYIAQTATQAFEDRARVSSFYLIAVGSLIATLFGTQLFEPDKITKDLQFMFCGLFLLLTLLGSSTVVQLAQLRSAWYESMLAMNQIKDFAMSQSPELAKAFRWKTSTLPAKYKAGNVSYYQAREVALISGLMFGAAMFFLQQAIFFPITNTWTTWPVSILLGALAVFAQMAVYKRILN